MKKNLQVAITTWITAVIMLVIGILCIVAQNATDYNAQSDAANAISLVLGIVFIIVGSLGIIINALLLKRTATATTIAAGVILAAGLFFVIQKTVVDLIRLLVDFVPYVLVVVGCLVILDAIIILVFGLVKKSNLKALIIPLAIELVIGIVALVLGILALPSVNVIDKRLTIFGILLIVYALFLAFTGVLTIMGKSLKANE
ncbi:MAG: hypothetical protein K6B64_03355 [Acholeplasmatales bacterium]|nr:hypothetical protein [Acholeplasmatales bacterium]